ncbi:MAG TPA: hypothetical protein VFO36_12975 [Nitrospiraceae bacterium]|nr:hypothetical protein [Nitrospiraceae bacterium]
MAKLDDAEHGGLRADTARLSVFPKAGLLGHGEVENLALVRRASIGFRYDAQSRISELYPSVVPSPVVKCGGNLECSLNAALRVEYMPKLVSNVVGSLMFCDNGLSGLLLQPLMCVTITHVRD